MVSTNILEIPTPDFIWLAMTNEEPYANRTFIRGVGIKETVRNTFDEIEISG
jgi:predicted secreted protein